MSDTNTTASARALLDTLRARWQALAPREQTALRVAGVVVTVGLVWGLAVQPAWRTLQTAPATRAALDLQWQRMVAEADDARALRALPPVSQDVALEALEAATERLGEGAELVSQGEARAMLSVRGLEPAALRQWLTEVRRGARARVVEARLQRGADGLSGSIVLALGGGGS